MNKKAVVLLSGGLDSTLAAHIVKEQGIEVQAINFQTIFQCCKDDARGVAYELGIPYTTIRVDDDYLDMVKNPKHGYGKGMNPCVDCRGYMFERAKKYMDHIGASFMISGEVLGQRPMSQKRADFRKIEEDTGLAGLILRPLSAKLLPPSRPETEGIVERSKLYAVQGRSRTELLKIARKYGVRDIPTPSTGCALTEQPFSKKVRDVFEHRPDYERWEFEVLRIGRHFRLSRDTKIILGRDENENAYLEGLNRDGMIMLKCFNFVGPSAVMIGEDRENFRKLCASVMLRYARKPLPDTCGIEVTENGRQTQFQAGNPIQEEALDSLRIV